MAKYRTGLPQLTMSTFMTDGGLETDLIFNQGIELQEFAAFDLLKNKDVEGVWEEHVGVYFAEPPVLGVKIIFA